LIREWEKKIRQGDFVPSPRLAPREMGEGRKSGESKRSKASLTILLPLS
jgi:hypothetical protein